MGSIAPQLENLIRRAQTLAGSVDGRFDGGTVYSVEELLRSALSLEEDREKRVQISCLLNDFKAFYRSMASSKKDSDAQVVIRDTQAFAYLTLVPPRSGGKQAKFEEVMRDVQAAGIRVGLNHAAVDAAASKLTKKDECVWNLEIASCDFPEKGKDARIEFLIEPFDKTLFFGENPPPENWAGMIHPVEAGTQVALIHPAEEGQEGINVRGERIPPTPGDDLKLEIGEGLKVGPDGTCVTAMVGGAPVLGLESADVVPFYEISGNLEGSEEIRHNGHVLVTGNIVGPLAVRAEDVYVAGNVEAADLIASGDLYVGGSIVGKRKGTVEADGRVYARAISDATVQSLGDVVVRNSIAYSEITSNGEVRVVAEQGTIVGGQVSALRAITARNVGSDFGTYTTTAVGIDFLTPKRLARIDQGIRDYEENLSKIDMLKRKLAAARVDVSKLPPEKQDIYISILQKEIKTREEINSLRRSKKKFDRAMKEFLKGSIRVMESIHPPVKVQIGTVIEEIKERMEKVTLVLDPKNRISARPEEE